MSKEEHVREDIMHEATGLISRAAYKIPKLAEELVIGFRRGGAMSLFVDQDPVYQFNTQGELRRAFRNGLLFKAEDRILVAMHRERTGAETLLRSTPLTHSEQERFLHDVSGLILKVVKAITTNQAQLLEEVTEELSVADLFLQWINKNEESIKVAERPNVEVISP